MKFNQIIIFSHARVKSWDNLKNLIPVFEYGEIINFSNHKKI